MYEYLCKTCGHRFEVIQKFSDKPLKKCPKCGKAVERLVSTSSIKFKGSGWYVTDYANRSGPADVKSESKAKKETSTEAAPSSSEKTEKATEKAKPSAAPASSPSATK